MKNDKKPFVKMGSFVEGQEGRIQGKIFGLGLGMIPVVFEPKETKEGGKTYLRAVALHQNEQYEIGAAFPKEDKNGETYHSVTFDSPALPMPINAALFADKNNSKAFNLVWTRPEVWHSPKAEATVNVNYPEHQSDLPATPIVNSQGGKVSRRSTGNSQPRL